jgi:AcrR family transcriptional regulator
MTSTAKPTRREQNLADIRQRAEPIAERIVLQEGIDALSARRLAGDLKISVGSLYNAFGDLDGVVREVIARSGAILTERLMAGLQTAEPDRRSRIIALGEAYLDFALDEPRRWWLLFEYRSDMTPDERSLNTQSQLLRTLIEAGDGDPASEPQRQFFLVLWASVHGLVSLANRKSIFAINPVIARSHIGALVDAGLGAFPET